MNDSKDSGSNLALWLPGSAIVLSLVVSTFALTRTPFIELRPTGTPFQVEKPIEARLWQDPFDALERYRKKHAGDKGQPGVECNTSIDNPPTLNPNTANVSYGASSALGTDKQKLPDIPSIMVALVEGGPYADEVELRRRIRYAVLAGFKNARMVPEDEQHIHCLALGTDLASDPATKEGDSQVQEGRVEIPYETFVADPLNPPTDLAGHQTPNARTMLFWVKQDDLGVSPLQRLAVLHNTLWNKLYALSCPLQCHVPSDSKTLKVIGPSNSTVLRHMYREESEGWGKPGKLDSDIEIYSPLATADYKMLTRGIYVSAPSENASDQTARPEPPYKIKLLRTISDDGTLTRLLLDELNRRAVNPATGAKCREGALLPRGTNCDEPGGWHRLNRVALISEWDSFYSRALTESFKTQVAERAGIKPADNAVIDSWVLHYSYLRGLDGRLPEQAASDGKAASNDGGKDAGKNSNQLDTSPLEKSDGDSQLDYLRRLADHIASQDEAYHRKGEPGIGAIGVVGTDAYDKLLVLQALKSRMPNKLFFSTDLDARLLQRGQAETTRNLVLASPYGLTLTRALQQEVPPFRDSLQSAVFIAMLAAQAPQSFEDKRKRFEYSTSALLSPGIYEVGISGFIPLASSLTDVCQASASVRSRTSGGRSEEDEGSTAVKKDIMQLNCLQDQPQPPYPEPSEAARKSLDKILSLWSAGPLSVLLLVLAIFVGWWWTTNPLNEDKTLPPWVRNLPMALYVCATLSAWGATWHWNVWYMWATFVLILLGIICSKLNSSLQRKVKDGGGLFDSSSYYILLPIVLFILVVLGGYQQRRSLTEEGLGEPMFLFEGISAWPTMALRLIAVLISISALAWGWRCLRINRIEIEATYRLEPFESSLWGQLPRFVHPTTGRRTFSEWLQELGRFLFVILFPLSSTSMAWVKADAPTGEQGTGSEGADITFQRFWEEHCMCGSFGARMLRAILATWIFVATTGTLYVLWPFEGAPIRGASPLWMLGWIVPTLAFQLLVFWVLDANRLLTRFIRQLSKHHALWPEELQSKHENIFGVRVAPCIDDWLDMVLIAKRSAAVNRLIYAPTVVLLILLMSRSSVFDNWPTPPSVTITFLLTALLLLISALSLRRAAEKARVTALRHIDDYLLKTAASDPYYPKFQMIRERVALLNTGAFSRYSEEPLVRALLLALTGFGGSAIVDALNYAKF